jgi:hypothetical protein
VGVFKDFETSIEGAAGSDDASAGRAGALQPVDLNDRMWRPIDGITLDKYAQLTAAMARRRLGPPEEAEAWLEDHGVKPGTWGNVQTGWVNRMAVHEAVRTRYGILYGQS